MKGEKSKQSITTFCLCHILYSQISTIQLAKTLYNNTQERNNSINKNKTLFLKSTKSSKFKNQQNMPIQPPLQIYIPPDYFIHPFTCLCNLYMLFTRKFSIHNNPQRKLFIFKWRYCLKKNLNVVVTYLNENAITSADLYKCKIYIDMKST